MGKMTKRYQTRRILAMILAVTMVVGMIPSTALAAPGSDGEQTVENAVAAQTTEGTEDKSSADGANADEDSNAAGTENTAAGGNTTTGTEDNADGEGDVPAGTDNSAAGNDATAGATGDNTPAGTDESTADNSTPAATDDPAPAAEKPVYEIVTDDLETEVVYTGYSAFDLSSVWLAKTENGETESTDEAVTAAWEKQGTDGNYTAMAAGTNPVDVGVYKLKLTCAAVADVHDAVTAEVICEITKAPAKILIGEAEDGKIPVAMGVLDVQSIKPTIGRIVCAGSNLDPEDLVLTVNGVRDAITGAEVKDGAKLKRDGDYVVDITPSFKADAAADRKAVFANYELEDFTADLIVADLIETIVEVKLADKYKPDENTDATTVIAKEYDTKPADAPKAQKSAEDTEYDYTYVVKYGDDTAGDSGAYVPLTDKDGKAVQAVGEWDTYEGCELDKDGKVLPPTDAGTYTYKVVYTDAEGIYNTSSAEFYVEIEPAVIKVEATNKGPLKVLEGVTAQEVLSQITYKVTNKEGKENDFISTKAMKAGNVWGTGFDDSNVSQIYEPLFTLQESADGSSWQNIDDADYELASDKKYRVIYDGKKAIYNANGTYSHRTDVNDDANINGVDYNYTTDTTPTADDKVLAVEVTPGTEVTIDVSKLLGDKKGALTIADLTAKIYDGKPIYGARSEYKNVVTVKPKDSTAKGPDKTLLREFTYIWEKYDSARDLLDAQIQGENQVNGFADWGPADEDNWYEDYGAVSPKNAGVYRLTITYEDQYDDGKLYYAKEPAVVYFAIDPVQVEIVPKGECKELEGHDGYDLLYEPRDKNTYELQAKNGTIVSGDNVVPKWEVIETRQQEAPAEPIVYTYDYNSCWDFNFEKNDAVSYALQGVELGQFVEIEDEDGSVSHVFESDANYTCSSSKKIEVGDANASGKKELERKDTFLNKTADITVVPMGTKKLTVEVDAAKWGTKSKEYDAKAFELKELLQGGAVTVKDEDGKVLTDQELSAIGFRYVGYIPDDDSVLPLDDCVQVGEYVLYAFFYGDATYAPLKSPENPADPWNPDDWGVKIGAFEITQKTISLSVNLPETYTAGVTAEDVLNAIPGNITVKNYAADDAGSFTEYRDWDEENQESHYYMWAWSYDDYKQDPSFQIYEKGAKRPVSRYEVLARDKTYEVRYDAENSTLTQFYNWWTGKYSYIISTDAAAEFTVVKGNSIIESIDKDGIESVVIGVKNDEKDSMKRTVTMLEGIGFASVTIDDKALEGNLAAFRITPPAEYRNRMPDTAMYKNAIAAANVNGYVTEEDGEGFTVIFDAREGTKTFPIRWEDGYVETYTIDFDNAVKLGDLNNAVAPKSLAFNAPDKKMAVGQSQQLDVKITKVQMGDVICLGYKSSDETVLTVNENGNVTALKYPGRANITVFPQHLVNGEMEPIPGAKAATVTITTTKMTAPKTVKVVTHGSTDAYVNLNYDTPADGYRREIYVVNNNVNPSLKKAADFEKLLAGTDEDSWKENKWQGTFAVAPLYLDSADESFNRRRNGYTAQLSGLATSGAYTVYVRNVCAARTLANGSVITNETVNASAAGTAVSFKTLKSELAGLKYELDDTAAGVTDISNDYDGEVWDDGEEYIDNAYRIELSKIAKGAVDGITYGAFYTMPKDETADGSDWEWITLPLKEKIDKNAYENPKLEYTLDECWNKKTEEYEFGSKNDIASIDKKGKIKITGMTGEDQRLVVRVRDTQTGTRTYVALHIMAQADSVMAKKKSITLSVGQSQDLNGLLDYKMGKQKLTYYPYADIDMNAVKTAIKDQKQEAFFELDQHGNLWAIAKGGKLQLELIDRNIANSFGKEKATAKVTFKTTDLTPVKKVKAYDVINDRFGLTFTYAGGADAFLVEIADANKTIYSKKFARAGVAEDSETGLWAEEEWDSKGNRVKDTYRIDSDNITNYVRLTKETQYTVKITALYDAIAAKPATAKVKTTKIPAISGYIGDYYDDDGRLIKPRGGMSIQVGEYDDGRELSEDSGTILRVLSGNSYTLTANVEYNRGRVNDTLVWTVDNAKVATVKAAAGSYCITLKGVKPGWTVLEVKSKIWGNKVVARYDINVVAVGDAYKDSNFYYGDDEPGGYTDSWISNGGNNAPAYLPLSVGDPRKVTANQREYFSFTAPETGRYEMSADGYVGGYINLYNESDSTSSRSGTLDLGWLQVGEQVSLRSDADVRDGETADIAYYVEVTLAQKVETVSSGQTIQGTGAQGIFKFTAPEDGKYEFSMENQWGESEYLYLYSNESAAIANGSYDKYGNLIEYDMTQGEDGSVWLKTSDNLYSWYEYTFHAEKISEDINVDKPAEITVAKNGGKKYLTFTVADDGYYKFSSQADTVSSNINVSLQVNDATVDSSSNSEFTFKQELHAGDKVCLVIENSDYSNDYTFKVSAESFEIPDLTAGTPVTVNTDGDVYKFTAAAAGIYRFSADSGAAVSLYASASDALKQQNEIYLETAGEKEMSAGDELYLTVALNGVASSQLNVSKISQDLDLTNGSEVTVGGYGNAYVTFTVKTDGYYKIASADGTINNSDIRVELVVNGDDENAEYKNDAQFEFKKDLKQGDVVRLKITNSGASDSIFTVKAEEVTIDAVPESGTTLAANSEDTVYKFTAADAGIYQFRMESAEQNTSLYLYDSMEGFENGGTERVYQDAVQDTADTSKYVCSIDILLSAGQIVYVNPRNSSSTADLSVTLGAEKKAVSTLTTGGSAETISVTASEIEQITFTAGNAGIYTFNVQNTSSSDEAVLKAYVAYSGSDSESSYDTTVSAGNTLEKPLVLAAGQTIVWTIEASSSDQSIAMSVALTQELKEIKVGDALTATVLGTDQADEATADGFVFRAPAEGTYTFWSDNVAGDVSNNDTYGYLFKFDQLQPENCLKNIGTSESPCLKAEDGGGPNSYGHHFAMRQRLTAGQTVYLKVIGFYSNKSISFNVCVEEGEKYF